VSVECQNSVQIESAWRRVVFPCAGICFGESKRSREKRTERRKQTADSKHQTAGRKQWKSRQQTADRKSQTVDSRSQTVESIDHSLFWSPAVLGTVTAEQREWSVKNTEQRAASRQHRFDSIEQRADIEEYRPFSLLVACRLGLGHRTARQRAGKGASDQAWAKGEKGAGESEMREDERRYVRRSLGDRR
jgi:hypothetical protein